MGYIVDKPRDEWMINDFKTFYMMKALMKVIREDQFGVLTLGVTDFYRGHAIEETARKLVEELARIDAEQWAEAERLGYPT
jgi:hypothetical protein